MPPPTLNPAKRNSVKKEVVNDDPLNVFNRNSFGPSSSNTVSNATITASSSEATVVSSASHRSAPESNISAKSEAVVPSPPFPGAVKNPSIVKDFTFEQRRQLNRNQEGEKNDRMGLGFTFNLDNNLASSSVSSEDILSKKSLRISKGDIDKFDSVPAVPTAIAPPVSSTRRSSHRLFIEKSIGDECDEIDIEGEGRNGSQKDAVEIITRKMTTTKDAARLNPESLTISTALLERETNLTEDSKLFGSDSQRAKLRGQVAQNQIVAKELDGESGHSDLLEIEGAINQLNMAPDTPTASSSHRVSMSLRTEAGVGNFSAAAAVEEVDVTSGQFDMDAYIASNVSSGGGGLFD